jgi:hypothetical protein
MYLHTRKIRGYRGLIMYGDAFGGLVKSFIFLIPFSILGIWKLIDIIIWIVQNVRITIGG